MSNRTKLTTYPEAARVIALYLDKFCNKNLDYVNMIAEAARLAAQEIDKLEATIKDLKTG